MMLTARGGRVRLDPSMLRLPLVALIDVVLFLLFYFMVAGNLAAEESELASTLQAQKAKAGAASALGKAMDLRVDFVNNKAVYRIGARAVATQAELAAILKVLPKEPGILISADGRASVDATAAALQAVQDAGFTRVTYVTRE